MILDIKFKRNVLSVAICHKTFKEKNFWVLVEKKAHKSSCIGFIPITTLNNSKRD